VIDNPLPLGIILNANQEKLHINLPGRRIVNAKKIKWKTCPNCEGDGYWVEQGGYEHDGTPILMQRMCDWCEGYGAIEDNESEDEEE
jgi:DnaJ-class molecular chaperone